VLSDFAPVKGYRYDGLYTVESVTLLPTSMEDALTLILDLQRHGKRKIPKAWTSVATG
jgi:hypothetical protein